MTTDEMRETLGVDPDPSSGPVASSPPEDGAPDATNLAIASAGASVIAFIALFRLTSGLDHTRLGALRRFLAVLMGSATGVGLGVTALRRLSNSERKVGLPFAIAGVLLGASNVVRVMGWLRLARPVG